MKYPTEDLITMLQEAYNKLGHVPTQRDLRENGLPHMTTFTHRFGSWKQAVAEAGIDPAEIKNNMGGRRERNRRVKYKDDQKCISGKSLVCQGTFRSELSPLTGRPVYFMCPPCRELAKQILDYP